MVPRFDDEGRFAVAHWQFVSTASPSAERIGIEPLGSKPKFWASIAGEPRPWLFKYARPATGEHWAEKLGAEIAGLLRVPSARAELAIVENKHGILVESVVPHDWSERMKQSVRQGDLVLGNEVLAGYISSYDKRKQWGQREHSYTNIVEAIRVSVPAETFDEVLADFAGLLVLDALIGNTDRHHENWALLRLGGNTGRRIRLSPSFDHASSLGRELTDAKREAILRDNAVGNYCRKGRGAIFGQSTGKHADNPLDLVCWAASQHPAYFLPWIERVHRTEHDAILALLNRMPESVFSASANRFCGEFLAITLKALREIEA